MLEEQRKKIDDIDDEIARLFIERLTVAGEIAKIKRENNIPVLNASREREILDRLTEGFDNETTGYIETLFGTIFEISRFRQEKLII